MQAWREIRPLVQRVLARTDEYAIGDVLHFLVSGEWQLWKLPRSFAVTRFAHFPQHKSCVVVMCAGELGEIVEAHTDLCDWARAHECKYMEIFGRAGWEKALGYKEQSRILRKEL